MSRSVKKRAYDSPVRVAQAARTRARIVEAAAELFEAGGYGRTTIRQIADKAGVAVDTVYATFHAKPRILTAVIDLRLAAGTGVGNVMERPEALAVRDEVDPRRQLHLLAADLAVVVERVGPAFELLRSAASVEPAMAKVYEEMQGYRLRNMRTAIDWVAARGPLRMSVEEAAEHLWVLASPGTARLLRQGRGWSRDRYAEWLSDSLIRTLLE